MTLYLLSYNNYYNRRMLYLRELEEYLQDGNLIHQQGGVNFNPNDGLTTSIIINYSGDAEPDYCLAVEDGDVVSRWYVIDTKRLRAGQYRYELYRDLLAEYFEELLRAPVFVEKAKLNVGNPLIYNSENMTYNQIKQNEYLLKDKTGVPWLVGYVPRNYGGGTITISADETPISYNLTSLDQYQYNQYTTNAFSGDYNKTTANYRILLNLNGRGGIGTGVVVFDKNCAPSQPVAGKNTQLPYGNGWMSYPGYMGFGWNDSADVFVDKTAQLYEIIKNVQMRDLYGYVPCNSELATQQFLAENNKIIQVGTDFYRIQINSTRRVQTFTVPNASDLANQMRNIVYIYGSSVDVNRITGTAYQIEVEYYDYTITYVQASINAYTLLIPQERVHLQDAPYDMFCMPYGNLAVEGVVGNGSAIDSLRFANTLAIELTQNNLFDLQLLPYCPLNREMIIVEQNAPSIQPSLYYTDETTRDKAVQYITDSDNVKYGAIFWCESSSFTTDPLAFNNITVPKDPIDFKIENECSFYRLCSPNYNGVFEISATKNAGLGNFKAYCTYKPFSPYIKVAPEFNGLYGSSFGDARGLICGGDFSLPFITDSWKQYQIQNKNYQVMFDRQIENMEVNNNLARVQDIGSAITGAVSGAVGGGMAGGMIGGGVGAAIGAVAGGITSAAGGAIDVYIADKMRAENLDYTKDMYGYQLGNIKALPQSLTKVSAYNVDNKIFPFLEYYTATDTEKQALRNKLTYNGMTVMAIGTMADYYYRNESSEQYFKAKLIRFPETAELDYHLVRAMADELYKGVFI